MPAILQILPKLNSGGVERGTIEIASAIVKEGFKSFVISAGGTMVTNLKKTGATHIKLDVASKNPIKILLNSYKIKKIIKKYNIDIIHARSRVPAWSAYLACKNTNAHFITTFHGVYSGKSWLKKTYNKIMLKGEKIITVSDFISNHIKENYNFKDKKKLVRIHRGVDLTEFNQKNTDAKKIAQYKSLWNIPEDKKIILLPGRLTDWKGQHFFIESLAKLKRDDYIAFIVGTASKHQNYKNFLIKLINEYNLTEKIFIKDNIKDLHNLYQLSNIVVSTSLRPEAFGRIMPEAGAMSKIVIATNHGGARETIINGETGFLIEAGNHEELAATLDKTLNLPQKEINKIGKNAKKYIEKEFSITKMQLDTINLYKKLLS